eukprot:PhM_4_TR2066/c0_g1_i1/m.61409
MSSQPYFHHAMPPHGTFPSVAKGFAKRPPPPPPTSRPPPSPRNSSHSSTPSNSFVRQSSGGVTIRVAAAPSSRPVSPRSHGNNSMTPSPTPQSISAESVGSESLQQRRERIELEALQRARADKERFDAAEARRRLEESEKEHVATIRRVFETMMQQVVREEGQLRDKIVSDEMLHFEEDVLMEAAISQEAAMTKEKRRREEKAREDAEILARQRAEEERREDAERRRKETANKRLEEDLRRRVRELQTFESEKRRLIRREERESFGRFKPQEKISVGEALERQRSRAHLEDVQRRASSAARRKQQEDERLNLKRQIRQEIEQEILQHSPAGTTTNVLTHSPSTVSKSFTVTRANSSATSIKSPRPSQRDLQPRLSPVDSRSGASWKAIRSPAVSVTAPAKDEDVSSEVVEEPSSPSARAGLSLQAPARRVPEELIFGHKTNENRDADDIDDVDFSPSPRAASSNPSSPHSSSRPRCSRCQQEEAVGTTPSSPRDSSGRPRRSTSARSMNNNRQNSVHADAPLPVAHKMHSVSQDSAHWTSACSAVATILPSPLQVDVHDVAVYTSDEMMDKVSQCRTQLRDPYCESVTLVLACEHNDDVDNVLQVGCNTAQRTLAYVLHTGSLSHSQLSTFFVSPQKHLLLCDVFLGTIGYCDRGDEIGPILRHCDSVYVRDLSCFVVAQDYQAIPRYVVRGCVSFGPGNPVNPLLGQSDATLIPNAQHILDSVDTILLSVSSTQRAVREAEATLRQTCSQKRDAINAQFDSLVDILNRKRQQALDEVDGYQHQTWSNLSATQSEANLTRTRALAVQMLMQRNPDPSSSPSTRSMDIAQLAHQLRTWGGEDADVARKDAISGSVERIRHLRENMKLDMNGLQTAVERANFCVVLQTKETSLAPYSNLQSPSIDVPQHIEDENRNRSLDEGIEANEKTCDETFGRSLYSPVVVSTRSVAQQRGTCMFNIPLHSVLSSGKSVSWSLAIERLQHNKDNGATVISNVPSGMAVGVAVGYPLQHWIETRTHDASHMWPLPMTCPSTLILVVEVIQGTRAQLKVLDCRGRVLDVTTVPGWSVTRPAYPQVTLGSHSEFRIVMVAPPVAI